MANSWVDRSEELVDIVADWAVNIIEESVRDLTTNGRPFGMPPRTTQERINAYQQVIATPESAFNYIDNKARELINELINSGVPEEDIASIHPYDLVISYVLNWSAEMEALIAKRGKKNANNSAVKPASAKSSRAVSASTSASY